MINILRYVFCRITVFSVENSKNHGDVNHQLQQGLFSYLMLLMQQNQILYFEVDGRVNLQFNSSATSRTLPISAVKQPAVMRAGPMQFSQILHGPLLLDVKLDLFVTRSVTQVHRIPLSVVAHHYGKVTTCGTPIIHYALVAMTLASMCVMSTLHVALEKYKNFVTGEKMSASGHSDGIRYNSI